MSNEELYDEAMAAIARLFSDQSVSEDETARQLLDALKSEIDVMVSTLP